MFWDFVAFWEFFNPFDEDISTIECPSCGEEFNGHDDIEVIDKEQKICRCPECKTKLKYLEPARLLIEVEEIDKNPICRLCGLSVEGKGSSRSYDNDKRIFVYECSDCEDKAHRQEEDRLKKIKEKISKEADASGVTFPEGKLKSQDRFVYQINQGEVVFYLDLISISLKEKEKNKVIQEMVSLFTGSGIVKDGKDFYVNLLYRETLGTTGFGDNIAIPYTTADISKDVVVSVGISKEGVDFESLDKKPVKIIFMSAMNDAITHGVVESRDSKIGMHLKFLAQSARLLKDQAFRDKLIASESKEEAFEILKESFKK
jgi:nitrogen PTS system EIIA component